MLNRAIWAVGAFALLVAAAAPAGAQELSLYGSALDGNLSNVLQFGYGGGVSFTALYEGRIGARVDAGWYESREHYSGLRCSPGTPEPTCTADLVTSKTPFNVQDLLLVFAPLSRAGARIYVGAGLSHFSLSNTQVGQKSDSIYSPKQTASGTGPALLLSIVGRPQWRYHFGGEATLVYHRPGRMASCSAGQSPPAQPFCGSLNVTELRLAIVYAPRWTR